MGVTKHILTQLKGNKVYFLQGKFKRFGYLKKKHKCPCCNETYWTVMRGNSGSYFHIPEKHIKKEL